MTTRALTEVVNRERSTNKQLLRIGQLLDGRFDFLGRHSRDVLDVLAMAVQSRDRPTAHLLIDPSG
jgi:hypothetical protein